MKVKDIDKLREKLHNDKREAFSKFQVWLMLSEHNTEVPTVDAVPMSVIDEIRAEIMSKDGLEEALEIIDKYKSESEDKE